MYTDNGLLLAAAEVVPNGGASPGGIGAASAALNLDPSGITELLRSYNGIGGGEPLCLVIDVTTSFTCATFNASLEIQLVSLPISASLLTNAATSGKRTHAAAVVTRDASDDFLLNGHGLPMGTPIYLSALATTTGIAINTIYYVKPTGANTFRVASSLANAIAGTLLPFGTGNGTATVEFMPTIHASTGSLRIFNVGVPTSQSSLQAGTRRVVPVQPLAGPTPQQFKPDGQTISQPIGAGPMSGSLATNAQRFYHLRYIPSATITAGAINCSLVHVADNSKAYTPSGFEVIG